MRLIRRLVGLALVGGIATVAFVSFANWRADGEFSLRVFDPAWWGVGKAKAQPYVDQAEEMSKEAYAAMWEKGGVVDQASDWIKDLRTRRAEPEAAPAKAAPDAPAADKPAPDALVPAAAKPATPKPAPAPAKPARSKATLQIEARLSAAEDLFEQGVQHYQAGNPTKGGYSDAKKKELGEAKKDFEQVRDILQQHLDQYEKMSDHDGQRAADARRMQHYNGQMLFNVSKMGGGI